MALNLQFSSSAGRAFPLLEKRGDSALSEAFSDPENFSVKLPTGRHLCIQRTVLRSMLKEQGLRPVSSGISKLIREHEISFPIHSGISREAAVADFENLKSSLSRDELLLKGSEPRYEIFRKKKYNPVDNLRNLFYDTVMVRTRVGRAASNYCQYGARIRSNYYEMPNVMESWRDEGGGIREHFIRRLIKSTSREDDSPITEKEMAAVVAKSRCVPAQFPAYVLPLTIKILREFSKVDDHQKWRVLDPCAGWSDRLIGALAGDSMISHYVGVDPNLNLAEGQEKAVRTFESTVAVKHVYKCFESVTSEDLDGGEPFDIVITSPPFFLKERYCDASTQSTACHTDPAKTIDENFNLWVKGFFLPMLDQSWHYLKTRGFLIIHINDFQVDSEGSVRKIDICDTMNSYIGSELRGQYLGAMGLASEPHHKHLWGIRCEPLWVWQKV